MSAEGVERWDGAACLRDMAAGNRRDQRVLVFGSTQRVFESGRYALLDGRVVELPASALEENRAALHAAVQRHVFRTSAALPDTAALRAAGAVPLALADVAPVAVVRGDCVDAAARLAADAQGRVALLNMASPRRAGGGYRTGAGAQEENLFRRSNLWLHLDTPPFVRNKLYPLPRYKGGSVGALYARDVLFVRANEPEHGYAFLSEPLRLDVVAVAAPVKPRTAKLADGSVGYASADEEAAMLCAIRAALQVCAANGARDVVLSALGCGAFHNPPEAVARLFARALDEYCGYFRRVVFAVYDDHNARGEGNFAPFQRVLNGYRATPPPAAAAAGTA